MSFQLFCSCKFCFDLHMQGIMLGHNAVAILCTSYRHDGARHFLGVADDLRKGQHSLSKSPVPC